MIKKIIIFILCTAPWFISFLFPLDYSYYESLILPSFAPPQIFFPIAWTTIYILIGYSISKILNSYKFKNIPNSYKIALIINYIFNQSFVLIFFIIKNNMLGFVSCVGTFVSSLFFYQESLLLNEKSTLVLRLYVLLSFFATILSLSIYLLNI